MNLEEFVLAIAAPWISKPYLWGGNGVLGIDCSGLALELGKSLGLHLPKDTTAQGLYDTLKPSDGSSEGVLHAGSFVFYGKDVRSITHVTFMLNSFLALGADGGDSSCISAIRAEQIGAFVKVRPYNYRPDVVAIVLPSYPIQVEQLFQAR